MIPRQVTAGTAGDGYRTEPDAHEYRPASPEPGERPHCTCGLELAEHQPARGSA